MKNRNLKNTIACLGVFFLGLMSIVASNHTGTFASAPELGLKITSISDTTPSIGDTVEIFWDYENADLLEIQGVRVVSLLIDGNLSTVSQGCFSFYPENQPCLDITQRGISLTFQSPVTVIIDAVDSNNRAVSKAIKLYQEGMNFELNQLEFTHNGYPRYTGNAVNDSSPLKFDKAFGVYAKSDGPRANISTFRYFENKPEFLNLFRQGDAFLGSSRDGREANNFGFARGADFPLLSINFRNQNNTPLLDASRSEVVIYAGVITLGGQIEMIKDNAGSEAQVITIADDASIEAFFYQIDLVETVPGNNAYVVSDVHVGNPTQGLVFSVYTGIFDSAALGTVGAANIPLSITPQQAIHLVSGNIKGSAVSFQIITLVDGNTLLVPRVAVSSNFQNIPVYPDTDLSPLFLSF